MERETSENTTPPRWWKSPYRKRASTFVPRVQMVTMRTALVSMAMGTVRMLSPAFVQMDLRNMWESRRPVMKRAQAEWMELHSAPSIQTNQLGKPSATGITGSPRAAFSEAHVPNEDIMVRRQPAQIHPPWPRQRAHETGQSGRPISSAPTRPYLWAGVRSNITASALTERQTDPPRPEAAKPLQRLGGPPSSGTAFCGPVQVPPAPSFHNQTSTRRTAAREH